MEKILYQLFDRDNKKISFKDLQDKGPWCEWGLSKEQIFLKNFGDMLGLSMNPAKRTDKFAPDLININNNRIGDLKTANTPFFQSNIRYNIDPQYAVVFNKKDRQRYEEKYSDIEIYYWVEWQAIRFIGNNDEKIIVNPMRGIWFIDFKELNSILDNCPLHWYAQRRNDKNGNAECSYVLSLQNGLFRKVG